MFGRVILVVLILGLLLNNCGKSPEEFYNRGSKLQEEGKFSDAVTAYEKASKGDAGDALLAEIDRGLQECQAEIYFAEGDSLLTQGDLKGAFRQYNAAFEHIKSLPFASEQERLFRYYVTTGHIYVKQWKRDSALEQYEMAVRFSTQDTDNLRLCYEYLAKMKAEDGDFASGKAYMDQAVNLVTYGEGSEPIGKAYSSYRKGDYQKAFEVVGAVLKGELSSASEKRGHYTLLADFLRLFLENRAERNQ